jgi:hypothetical protein
MVDRLPHPFFQGKGRQIFEKKAKFSIKTGKLPVRRRTIKENPSNEASYC